jgi:undecaprenyl-diphosphatase
MTELDRALFHWLNSVAVAPPLDPLMEFVTSSRVWQVVLVAVALWLATRRDRPSRVAALSLGLSLVIADVLASQVLKPLIGRARPCHVLDGVRLVVAGCGGRNGFPSNHAANAAAAAAALGIAAPRTLVVTAPLAILVAWSRVYVGVHYPGDVLAGLVVGAVVGTAVSLLLRKRFQRPAASGAGAPGDSRAAAS